MVKNNTLFCPQCGAKLIIPNAKGKHYARCGACKYIFEIPWIHREATHLPMRRKKSLWVWAAISLSLLFTVGIGFLIMGKKPTAILARKPSIPAKWITISYDELLDKTQITQSGETLSTALKRLLNSSSERGAVQPFLGHQASLLIDAVDTIFPSSGAPWIHLGNYFEPGNVQPAWAALMRGGRVLVAATGDGRARVFVPGTDPQVAYQSYYSIVRHALAQVLPENGNPVSVEVFAFENNYVRCELLLNEVPFIFEASSFSPPNGKRELDLGGLDEFLREEVILEGGSISKDEGLVFYGTKGALQTLAGRPASLADLAVAYRAVFHAGDNTAFISLDPHLDHTKVNVNFGGYLEDTAIGAVILEADKRFKTISTGLDPNTFRDLRNVIRTAIPGFKTSSELEASDNSISPLGGWVGTRFWFYPESIRVETDFDGYYARIVNAQFTADAERSREDYIDEVQFEASKKRQLSPHIKRSIDDLNANYLRYASIFPELRELLVVGRYIGLMSWLNRLSDLPIDLDAILAVNLPAFRTDREKNQLLSATTILRWDGGLVRNSGLAKVTNLTPILDATIKGHFRDTKSLATYLALRSGGKNEDSRIRFQEAEQIFREYGQDRVRSLIKTKDDLEALAIEAAKRTDAPEPGFFSDKKVKLNLLKSRIEAFRDEIEQMRSIMDRDAELHNRYLERYNRLVDEYNSLRVEHNSRVDELNTYNLGTNYITEIGGGISLRPKEFSVVNRSGSPLISEMRTKAINGITQLPKTAPLGSWVRSRIRAKQVNNHTAQIKLKADAIATKSMSDRILAEWVFKGFGRYWQAREKGEGGWRDQIKRNDGTQRERFFNPADSSLHIIERSSSGSSNHIVARKVSSDRIIFTRESQSTVVNPGSPPFWYEKPTPIKLP